MSDFVCGEVNTQIPNCLPNVLLRYGIIYWNILVDITRIKQC